MDNRKHLRGSSAPWLAPDRNKAGRYGIEELESRPALPAICVQNVERSLISGTPRGIKAFPIISAPV